MFQVWFILLRQLANLNQSGDEIGRPIVGITTLNRDAKMNELRNVDLYTKIDVSCILMETMGMTWFRLVDF